MTKQWLLILAMLLPINAVIAQGDPNLAQLQEQLAQQQKVLAEMQAKLAAMEAKQTAVPTEPNTQQTRRPRWSHLRRSQAQQAREQQAMSQKMEYIQNGEINWPKSMEWVKNVKLSGDFRYRYENIDEEGLDDRNRNRIRAVLALRRKSTTTSISAFAWPPPRHSQAIIRPAAILSRPISRSTTLSRKSLSGLILPMSSGIPRILPA